MSALIGPNGYDLENALGGGGGGGTETDPLSWHLLGNAGTVTGTNFLGTTDAINLMFKVNNVQSGKIEFNSLQGTAFGYQALSNTTAGSNAAFGYQALAANTGGSLNAAFGFKAMAVNIGGYNNAAFGNEALVANTSGNSNVAIGYHAMWRNVNQGGNVAVGASALNGLLTNGGNTAIGSSALSQTTEGANTGVGSGALTSNTTGYGNTAVGSSVAGSTTTGNYNVAMGQLALSNNTTGQGNVAIGSGAAQFGTTTSYGTAVGYDASLTVTGADNTSVGYSALGNALGVTQNVAVGTLSARYLASGSNNVFLGRYAGLYQNVGNSTDLLPLGVGWTTTGWTGSDNTYTHTPGNTTPLSNSVTAEANQYYIINITSTGVTTGSVTATFGGRTIFSGLNGNYVQNSITFPTTTTANLVFTPTSDFDGTLTVTVLKQAYASRITNSVFLGQNTQSYLGTDNNTIVIGDSVIGRGANTVTIGNSNITSTQLTGKLLLASYNTLPTYTDEAAATSGGLVQNTVYKTPTGELRIKL